MPAVTWEERAEDLEFDLIPSYVRNTFFPYRKPLTADLSDIKVVRHKPWLIDLIEPLQTDAPGPPKAKVWCCYINTIIFYEQPWRVVDTGGTFAEFDRIEHRIRSDDVFQIGNEMFRSQGGTVSFEDGRWIMTHRARRYEDRSGEREAG